MAVRRLHPDQDEHFAFSDDNLAWANATIKKYPEGKQASAVIPLLWRAQEQHGGWLPEAAIRYVANLLSMAPIRVYEVATFYTMFQLSPVGTKAHIQVCGTTPCMLRGSEALIDVCKSRIGDKQHTPGPDGAFSWEEVECLGCCANAPVVQIGADVFEDLTADRFEVVLDGYASGNPPKAGPQTGRQASCPEGGPTTLLFKDRAAKPARAGKLSADATSTVAMQRPEGLDAPRNGEADDLKQISGVGAQLEGLLHQLGIFHFDQISHWTPGNVRWVDDHLRFKGRIEREDWIEQARRLAQKTPAQK